MAEDASSNDAASEAATTSDRLHVLLPSDLSPLEVGARRFYSDLMLASLKSLAYFASCSRVATPSSSGESIRAS